MKLVEYMDGIWRLSDRNYKKMITTIKAGKDIDLDSLGKFLGGKINVTDLTAEQAALELRELRKEENLKRGDGPDYARANVKTHWSK